MNITPELPASVWKTKTVAPIVEMKPRTTANIRYHGATTLRSSRPSTSAISRPATGKITDRSRLVASRMSVNAAVWPPTIALVPSGRWACAKSRSGSMLSSALFANGLSLSTMAISADIPSPLTLTCEPFASSPASFRSPTPSTPLNDRAKRSAAPLSIGLPSVLSR